MTATNFATSDPSGPLGYVRAMLATAKRWPLLWIAPPAVAVFVALLVALFGPKQWRAVQTFLVREELIGRIVGPGRFDSLDTLKMAQETIQEVAKSPAVLRRTLIAVGPTKGKPGHNWPSEKEIEGLRDSISFYAPNGAEFGKTEILMLSVQASTRLQAKELAKALFREMQNEVRQVRQDRASSMQKEIAEAVSLAEQRLQESATRLQRMETSIGEDLADLRGINDSSAGSGELQKLYAQIQTELRDAISQLDSNTEQHRHLTQAATDPNHLLATPRELLALQPALARLKDKLIDAQITQSTLHGRYSSEHPAVRAAINSVGLIKDQINAELENAIRGLESQLKLAQERVHKLEGKSNDVVNRLRQLADMRIDYGRVLDEMGQHREELTAARKELAQAESIRQAAARVDMVTGVDEPQVGTRPIGLSKKALVAGAGLAGLFISIGLLMVVTPGSETAATRTISPAATPPSPQSSLPPSEIESSTELIDSPGPTDLAVTIESPRVVTELTAAMNMPPEATSDQFTDLSDELTEDDALPEDPDEYVQEQSSPKSPQSPAVFIVPDISQHAFRDQTKQ